MRFTSIPCLPGSWQNGEGGQIRKEVSEEFTLVMQVTNTVPYQPQPLIECHSPHTHSWQKLYLLGAQLHYQANRYWFKD